MKRRSFLKTTTAGLTASAMGGFFVGNSWGRTGIAAGDYNVLHIMSDEHAPGVLGCYGNPIVKTPAIDSLATNGVRFSSAYCQSPICVPSRASLWTSLTPSNMRCWDNKSPFASSFQTMAHAFKAAGYHAPTAFGKMHFLGNDRKHGFAHPFGDGAANTNYRKWSRNRTNVNDLSSRLPQDARVSKMPLSAEKDTGSTNFAIDFLKKHKSDRFFAVASFVKPHFPFTVQQQYFDLYDGKMGELGVPEVTQAMLDDLPRSSVEWMKDMGQGVGCFELTDAQILKARTMYYGMVSYVDDLVKDLLAALDELDLRKNTIVIYTSDHGEMIGEHNLWYKNCFYEQSVRVPLIISLPGVLPENMTVDAPVELLDLFPTLTDLTKADPPSGIEGHSLLPLIDGSDDGSQRYARSEYFSYMANKPTRMIRQGDYKYCWFHQDSKEQLFNLKTDPMEANNLIGDASQKDRVKALKAKAFEEWSWEGFKGAPGKPEDYVGVRSGRPVSLSSGNAVQVRTAGDRAVFTLNAEKPSRCSYSIHDALGRPVWKGERMLSAGRHEIAWNFTGSGGQPVSAGSYVMRAVIDGVSHSVPLTRF